MFQKIKEATKSAVASVDAGVKKLSYRSEISERRRLIRSLKGEWGCCLYDVMDKPNRSELLQSSFEVLNKAISEKMEEIHRFEEKYLTLHEVIGDSFAVHRLKGKPKDKAKDKAHKELDCATCKQEIKDDRISCGVHNFHTHCFHCSSCEKDITVLPQVFFLDFKPFCDECGEKNIIHKIESIDEQELLEWVHAETKGFNQVEIKDFEPMTWRNGLGFSCLCVKYFPDLFRWKPLTEGLMNDAPLGVCQAGLDGLTRAGVTMLFLEGNELRESDKKSVMIQIMLIRKFLVDKPINGKGVNEWNLNLGKVPSRHFEKSDFRKEHESLDKTGTIRKEADRLDQEKLLQQEHQQLGLAADATHEE
jgi:hypothetical protein